LVGGGIFKEYIKKSESEIAETIVKAALLQRKNNNLKIVFVDFGANKYFKNAWEKIRIELESDKSQNTRVVHGDITNFATHQCSTIVNAANSEIIMTGQGGTAGVIGIATGNPGAIDKEAKQLIQKLNQRGIRTS